MLAQALALGAMGAALAWSQPAATALGALATVLQAGHSHAFAISPDADWLLAAQTLHLLAAGAWLGSLIPLLSITRTQPPAIVAVVARRFSIVIGLPAVAAMVGTALFQATALVGGWSGLFGTPYGAALLTKAVLFLLVLCLAAFNRLRLTPLLTGSRSSVATRELSSSIAAEIMLGLLLVLVAATLSNLEPGVASHHASTTSSRL
jgi:putative copper export protein